MSASLEWVSVRGCDPARFARMGAGLLARAEAGAAPTLLVGELSDEAILLGRHQRLSSCLNAIRAPLGVDRSSRSGLRGVTMLTLPACEPGAFVE